MVKRLHACQPDFEQALQTALDARKQVQDVSDVVIPILKAVRQEGDVALCRYTEQLDQYPCSADMLAISPERIAQADTECTDDVKQALTVAAARIRDYHQRQLPQDMLYTDTSGCELGWRWRPLDAVGLYVPGGKAAYPSSVLMNAIPAKIAGCRRLVMTVPTPHGVINPALLIAAQLAGVDEIYTVGGAQAVAALAYGTERIAPVDKIVGPGNAFVTEAKRQLYGLVGLDTIAGPSEICVVADRDNEPAWIAADLLSQSEHDMMAQSILIVDQPEFAQAVEAAIDETLHSLPRADIARSAWEEHGLIIEVEDVYHSAPVIDRLAPEHLELAVADPQRLAERVRHAGAIFMGRYCPEAVGDYIAGPSHVLPTTQAARFASGLSVYDFLKKTSLIGCNAEALEAIGPAAATLADCEGLDAHALSVRRRLS